jgi:hypothetical protein
MGPLDQFSQWDIEGIGQTSGFLYFLMQSCSPSGKGDWESESAWFWPTIRN